MDKIHLQVDDFISRPQYGLVFQAPWFEHNSIPTACIGGAKYPHLLGPEFRLQITDPHTETVGRSWFLLLLNRGLFVFPGQAFHDQFHRFVADAFRFIVPIADFQHPTGPRHEAHHPRSVDGVQPGAQRFRKILQVGPIGRAGGTGKLPLSLPSPSRRVS